ncbi:MAG: hypothetical protein QOJ09_2684, partial [Actinomycetota bacterium]|nr:hypothetical protein [Actinomycetota bacterium]
MIRVPGASTPRLRTLAAVLSAVLFCALAPAASADQWYKTDTHVHSSSVSGDAPQDIGVIAAEAHLQGIDAIFLTDHTAAGTQQIGGVVSNHPRFDDDITQWTPVSYVPASGTFGGTSAASQSTASSLSALNSPTLGSSTTMLCELGAPLIQSTGLNVAGPNSTTNEVVSMPTNTGTSSLHLAATNSAYGESFSYLKRGPNLHSGNINLKFSVNPTRIDAGSGMYVSLSIGGDDGIGNRPPTGYTPQGGTPSLSKHTVLIWQLGNPRQDSTDPNARVITHQLPYMAGVWNNYTIDVSAALNEIPVADRPSDLDGLAI